MGMKDRQNKFGDSPFPRPDFDTVIQIIIYFQFEHKIANSSFRFGISQEILSKKGTQKLKN